MGTTTNTLPERLPLVAHTGWRDGDTLVSAERIVAPDEDGYEEAYRIACLNHKHGVPMPYAAQPPHWERWRR